jgi:hypothetical protein
MPGACTSDWLASHVPGARELIAWFGYWPSFHDAEVTSIELVRSGVSRISVHTFEATNELNQKGQYICRKHVIVEFLLGGISSLDLNAFNHQNVISGLVLTQAEQGYTLELEGCYGVDGAIAAESVEIKLAPGPPSDSLYLQESMP